jgi:hypothetical protein
MQLRILDLDGALAAQTEFLRPGMAEAIPMQDWGGRIRLACSFGTFRQFEQACRKEFAEEPTRPILTWYGSGDFHHVTFALLRRLRGPFNLLVLDKHPDWMRGVPVMHCGTWLYHALRLPGLQRVFHLGGELDFDNLFRWLAPWGWLRAGKIMVCPAVRRFVRGNWRFIPNEPLRETPERRVTAERLNEIMEAARADLMRYPLYISLDKDVMRASDAVVNWDSGYLELREVQTILSWFVAASGGNLAGMDIPGDWSTVRVAGLFRRALHWTEHPALTVDADEAARRNARTNRVLLETMLALSGQRPRQVSSALAG